MTTFDVAVMIAGENGERPVVATVTEYTRVADLALAAGGSATAAVARLGEPLDPDATLGDLGVRAGDTLQLGDAAPGDWKRLGPELRVIGGVDAGNRKRIAEQAIVLGRGDDADMVLTSRTVSRRHAELCWRGAIFTVRDLGSRHGTFVDGRRLQDGEVAELRPHAAVVLGDTVVTVAAGSDPSALTPSDSSSFTLPAPAPGGRRTHTPYLVPSAGAAGLAAAAAGAPTTIAVAATPLALGAGIVIDRVLSARAARQAETARAAEIAAVRQAMRAAAAQIAATGRANYPDPALLLGLAERRSPMLWATPPEQLSLRVGLTTVPDAVAVQADDADRDAMRNAAAAHLVPATVGVASGPVRVVGAEPFLDDLFAWLVVQGVASCSPDDLELIVVSEDVERWAWTVLLPHTRSKVVLRSATASRGLPEPERPARLVVFDRCRVGGVRPDDLVLVRADAETARRRDHATVISALTPAHVAITGDAVARGEVLADVLHDPPTTTLACAMHLAALGGQGRAGLGLPARVRLPDIIPAVSDAAAIARGWRRASDALVAVIGVDSEGPIALSLEGASSHVLVAGTTGAGKTRLLETLALGLAANYSPAALNLMTIDFKGGNELAGLSRLPHCVGAVSDRDPAQVDRAIAALTRELARRDELFASVHATDRHDYVAKSGQPMAHLVVIADEFGQFRREDAAGTRVAALLRIAAQGRSKGVHLVLATQSPSIDVTPEIRQNVGVRLCLRVTEPAESVAVLGTTDAAQLVAPGRVVVSDGERTRVAQVALSRGPTAASEAAPAVIVRELVDVAAGRNGPASSDLPAELFDAIAEAITIAACTEALVAAELLGPPLPERLARRAIPGASDPWPASGFVIAQRDRPGTATPAPLSFDPRRHGACTIVGGPRSGRTTTLLALAEAARDQPPSTQPVVVHAIDWSGGLDVLTGAACDGGVVAYRDFEHLRRMLRWIRNDGLDGATRLLLVDRLDALLRDLRDLDGGGLANELLDALQTGPRRRLYSAVTVDPVSLVAGGPQLGGLRIVLPVEDPTLVSAAGLPRRSSALAGRAVALPDGDDVQVGLPAAPNTALQTIDEYVGPMPSQVDMRSLPAVPGERAMLGIGGTVRLAPLELDLDRIGPVAVIIGRASSGKSTALATIAHTYGGTRPIVRDVSGWNETGPPSLLLLDDAARVTAAGDPDLPERLRAGGHTLVAAFDQSDVQGLGFAHWLMRRPCPGLLLSLDATSDRIVAGERVGFHPPAELRAGPAGRGWWCERGHGTPVQVATT